MNLLEKLNEYDDSTPMKLGAIDGARYFYCGTVGEFKSKIGKYTEVGREAYAKCVDRYRTELDELIKDQPKLPVVCAWAWKSELCDVIDNIAETAINSVRSPERLQLLRWASQFGTWSRKTVAAANKFKAVSSLCDVWIPYGELYVTSCVDVDLAADPVGGIRVMIEGYEAGPYWTHEEAKGKPHFKIMSASKGPAEFGFALDAEEDGGGE